MALQKISQLNSITGAQITASSDVLAVVNNNETKKITVSGLHSGSFSGSFQGDGSGITGVTGEWDGSHLGNASITGSLTVSGTISASGDVYGENGIFSNSISTPTWKDESISINATDGDLTINASVTASSDISASGDVYGVTGSFKHLLGDGSQLTGVTSEWDGTLNGDAEITGSLILSGSNIDLNVLGNITASGNISASGDVTANTLRLTSTTDASATSTDHAFQAGLTSDMNVIIDVNEVMARNNGAVSNLHLNSDGGIVTFNNGVGGDEVSIGSGDIIASGNITGSGMDIDSGVNISPTAFGNGQLTIGGSGYTGYNALDATAMYIGHNSSGRELILQTNETDRIAIGGNGQGVFVGMPSSDSIGYTGLEVSGSITLHQHNGDSSIAFTDHLDVTTQAQYAIQYVTEGLNFWTPVGSHGGFRNYNLFISASGGVGMGMEPGSGYKTAGSLDLSTANARKFSGTTWATGCDERKKENIITASLDICYDAVKDIPLKRFTWRTSSYGPSSAIEDKSQIGWIAQDVQATLPHAIKIEPFTTFVTYTGSISITGSDGKTIINPGDKVQDVLAGSEIIPDMMDLQSDQIVKFMYGTIQKLQQKVEALETQISELL